MARVKQVVEAQAVPVKKTAKKSALKPSPTSPAPRASALRKKLRFSRKRSFLRLPAAFFRRLLGGFGIHAAALAALQVGCEVHLLALLEAWGLCARHAKRVAVEAADVRLGLRRVLKDFPPGWSCVISAAPEPCPPPASCAGLPVLVGNNLRVQEIHQNLRRAELRRLQEEEEGILVSLEARIVKILEKKTHNFGPNGHNATQKMPGA